MKIELEREEDKGEAVYREETVCILDRIGVHNTPGPTFVKTAQASPCRYRAPDANPIHLT